MHEPFLFYADINECEVDDSNNCHENAQCTNTVGSFTCSCNPGYTGDGVNCTSTLLLEIGISYDAIQVPTWLYRDLIRNPFYLHVDVDECESDDLNNCHENAQCTDTEGNYSCSCYLGYTGDGVNCTGKMLYL